MISAGDFRNGITFEMENSVWQVIEFQHVKPGKGAAFVRTKLKNIITGATIERSFSPTDKMPRHMLTGKRCNTFITMASFIILWMLIIMSRFR